MQSTNGSEHAVEYREVTSMGAPIPCSHREISVCGSASPMVNSSGSAASPKMRCLSALRVLWRIDMRMFSEVSAVSFDGLVSLIYAIKTLHFGGAHKLMIV